MAMALLTALHPYLVTFNNATDAPVRRAMSVLTDEVRTAQRTLPLLPLRGAKPAPAAGSAAGKSTPTQAPKAQPPKAAAPKPAAPKPSPAAGEPTPAANGPARGSAEHRAAVSARALDAVANVLRLLAPPEWWAEFSKAAVLAIENGKEQCRCGRTRAHTREVCSTQRPGAYRRHLQHLLEQQRSSIPEAVVLAHEGLCAALQAGQSLAQAVAAHLPAAKPAVGKRPRAQAADEGPVPMEGITGNAASAAAQPPRKAPRSKPVRARVAAPAPVQAAAPAQVQGLPEAFMEQVMQQLAVLQARVFAAPPPLQPHMHAPPIHAPMHGVQFVHAPPGPWGQ